MSTNESVQLDLLEKHRRELLNKLPWYKRFYRKYMTGDSFWSWQLSSLFTYPQAFALGAVTAVKTPTVAAFILKAMEITGAAAAKAWAFIVAVVVGAWNAAT